MANPTEEYYKARRFSLAVCFIAFVYGKIGFHSSGVEEYFTLLGFKILNNPNLLWLGLAALVLSLWQFIAAYFLDKNEMRENKINRLDSMIVVILSAYCISMLLYKVCNSEWWFYVPLLAISSVWLVLLLSAEFIKQMLVEVASDPAAELRLLLVENKWELYYTSGNPNAHKTVTFEPAAHGFSGMVGQGRNQNECSWRIRGKYLEIYNDAAELYSRFKYDQKTDRLTHTNDPDTKSNKGQYFIRIK